MCALLLTHPRAHTPGAVDTHTHTHLEQWAHTHTDTHTHTHTHTPRAVGTHTPGAVETHTHLEQWTHLYRLTEIKLTKIKFPFKDFNDSFDSYSRLKTRATVFPAIKFIHSTFHITNTLSILLYIFNCK